MSAAISRRRWVAKKAARLGLAAAQWGTGALAAQRAIAPGPRVRVLTYHRFGDATRDPFCVRRRDFEAQVRWLADNRLAVSLDDVEAFLRGERDLPDGAALVTIDDGCRSTWTHATPILRAHGVPAVAFVVAGAMGTGRGPAGEEQPEDYMTWDELARVAESGVTIGSHAIHHRSLGRMSIDEAREEAERSRELLEQRLGRSVSSFAYPFGTLADFSDATARVLRKAGYTTVWTSQHGAVARGMDAFSLPRIKVEGGEPLWMFTLACRGALDAWRVVDRAMWKTQVRGRE